MHHFDKRNIKYLKRNIEIFYKYSQRSDWKIYIPLAKHSIKIENDLDVISKDVLFA